MHNVGWVQTSTHHTTRHCLDMLECFLGMRNVCRVQTTTHGFQESYKCILWQAEVRVSVFPTHHTPRSSLFLGDARIFPWYAQFFRGPNHHTWNSKSLQMHSLASTACTMCGLQTTTHHTAHWCLVVLECLVGMHNVCKVRNTTNHTSGYQLVLLQYVFSMHNVCRVQTTTHGIKKAYKCILGQAQMHSVWGPNPHTPHCSLLLGAAQNVLGSR